MSKNSKQETIKWLEPLSIYELANGEEKKCTATSNVELFDSSKSSNSERVEIKMEEEKEETAAGLLENANNCGYGISLSYLIPPNILKNALDFANNACSIVDGGPKIIDVVKTSKSTNADDPIKHQTITIGKTMGNSKNYKEALVDWLVKNDPNFGSYILLAKEITSTYRNFTIVRERAFASKLFDMLRRNNNHATELISDCYRVGYLTPKPFLLYHETVYKSKPCRIYFDFDYEYADNVVPNLDSVRASEMLEAHIVSFTSYVLKKMKNIVKDAQSYFGIVWDASNDSKFSKHVFFSSRYDDVFLKEKRYLLSFLHFSLFEWLFHVGLPSARNDTDVMLLDRFVHAFDTGIYIKNGEFRTLFSTKNGEKRFFVLDKIVRNNEQRIATVVNVSHVIVSKIDLTEFVGNVSDKRKEKKDVLFDKYASTSSSSAEDDDEEQKRLFALRSKELCDAITKTVSENSRFGIGDFKLPYLVSSSSFKTFLLSEESTRDFACRFEDAYDGLSTVANSEKPTYYISDWYELCSRSMCNIFPIDRERFAEGRKTKYITSLSKYDYEFLNGVKFLASNLGAYRTQISQRHPAAPDDDALYEQKCVLLKKWIRFKISNNNINDSEHVTHADLMARLYNAYDKQRAKKNSTTNRRREFAAAFDDDTHEKTTHRETTCSSFSDNLFRSWLSDAISSNTASETYASFFLDMVKDGRANRICDEFVRNIRSMLPKLYSEIWKNRDVSVDYAQSSLRIKTRPIAFKFQDDAHRDSSQASTDENNDDDDAAFKKKTQTIVASLKSGKFDNVEQNNNDDDDEEAFEKTLKHMFRSDIERSRITQNIASATLRFELENCKYCPIKYDATNNGEHKSNHVYFFVDLIKKLIIFQCHDDDCRRVFYENGNAYRSQYVFNIPSSWQRHINIYLQFNMLIRGII
jgi:hypothetical protein